ncbi:DUF2975 domain-containing protein [Brevundimonas sp. PAMC22021]|uniref:DUF2975 domain-containing protein n=1 Tax=Brevundimonas sp. PAMC22021 TaxID=2861285 RepID=UPI001C62D0C7|nr:DUF2975 domain-containing protein [Brevundimonas sp. PAMC22021]QYF87188.1 DUF2975 domain-containing protein [Brevundimonas sp. PAMC22021]
MKLIGKRSVSSVLRWFLGLANVFVALATVIVGLVLVASVVIPDFGAGLIDGLRDEAPSGERPVVFAEHLTLLGGFFACGFTWWIINRLRRVLLSVNRGDAFEHANVNRLRAVGVGLIGIQLTALLLAMVAPGAIGQSVGDYDFSLGSWLGILVVFILAEVFRQGADMRDEQLTLV